MSRISMDQARKLRRMKADYELRETLSDEASQRLQEKFAEPLGGNPPIRPKEKSVRPSGLRPPKETPRRG